MRDGKPPAGVTIADDIGHCATTACRDNRVPIPRMFSVMPRTNGGIFDVYATAAARLSRASRPAHVRPEALFYDQDFDPAKRPSREVCLAMLQEVAGRPDDALRTLHAVRAELTANHSGSLTRAVDASIARLSRRPPQSSKAR